MHTVFNMPLYGLVHGFWIHGVCLVQGFSMYFEMVVHDCTLESDPFCVCCEMVLHGLYWISAKKKKFIAPREKLRSVVLGLSLSWICVMVMHV